MARTGFKIALVLAFVVFVIAPQHAAAQCGVAYGNGFTGASTLSNEGLKERPSDIKITSGGAPNCFSAGNTISVTYNGILTLPATLTNASQPQYIALTNPLSATDGQLVLDVSTISGISSSGPQTVIQMQVIGATTDPGASITLQNLRFSVTGLAPAQVFPGTAMNAFVSGSAAGLTGVVPLTVGDVLSTISTTAGAESVLPLGGGTGQQSSGGALTTQANVSFATAPGWNISPFRVAIAKPAFPVGCGPTPPAVPCTDTVDNPTTATSLIFDVENIPNGVTVTFPPTISIWPGPGATVPTMQWKLRTTGSGAGVVTAIYDTVVSSGGAFSLVVKTAAAAADATPGVAAPFKAATPVNIGVQIGTASGNGTATLRVVFGPGGNPPGVTAAAAFAGDDFNAAAVPNYIPFISTAGIGREIITDTVINPVTGTDTAGTAFFTIQPTQSAILFQYATDRDSYATGLAITNTGNDSTIFNTKGQTGPVIWYLFANGATAPIIYQTKSGDGTGLDSNGNLAPGNTLAITLDELLNASGNSKLLGTFSGYVIALGEFNYGHGFAIFVDGAGHFSSLNSLFLGSSVRLDFPGSNGLEQ